MTTYFDTMSRELDLVRIRHAPTLLRWRYLEDINQRAGEAGSFDYLQAYGTIERRVVSDCTFAAMQPEFPADLREQVHRVVLRHGIETMPDNAPPADFETEAEHHHRLQNLVNDMHSIWHDVAHRGICVEGGYLGDSPRHAHSGFLTRGETERERMVDTDPDTAEHAKAYRARLAAQMAKYDMPDSEES